MRTVIGEYASMVEAERAVRALESKISIQHIVITDQGEYGGRRRDSWRDRILSNERKPSFLVSMSGTREAIEQARALLRAATASH
jgi:hypothetical protein